MNERPAETEEGTQNPLVLLGGAIVLIALLLAFSGDEGKNPSGTGDGKTTIKSLRGNGGGVGAFIPGAPAPGGMQNGGGLPDGPGVDTVETVRDMMNRLPTNRNDPEGYNPSGHYTPKPT